MSAVLNNVRDLSSSLDSIARIARIDAANKARATRLQQITEANELRSLHGIRTKQELMNVLRNLLASCRFSATDSMQDYIQEIKAVLRDMECPALEADE